MRPGSIVRVFATIAGKEKFQLCLALPVEDGAAARFLFLNSEARFRDHYVVPDTRLSFMPASRTGETCFCFSQVVRMNERQLEAFKPTEVGVIDAVLAAELRQFADSVRSLSAADLRLVKEALDQIVYDLTPPF